MSWYSLVRVFIEFHCCQLAVHQNSQIVRRESAVPSTPLTIAEPPVLVLAGFISLTPTSHTDGQNNDVNGVLSRAPALTRTNLARRRNVTCGDISEIIQLASDSRALSLEGLQNPVVDDPCRDSHASFVCSCPFIN